MKQWKTADIKALLEEKVGEFIKEIQVQPAGGDVDTEGLYLIAKGCEEEYLGLFIKGFRTDWEPIPDPSDVEIEMIELTDGQDSSGGLQSDDEATCLLYGRVFSILKKEGFQVVPKLDPYF